MRLFTLIFSLILFGLSIAPCSLTDHCCDEDVQMSSDIEKHTICTPFCAACASINAIVEITHTAFEFHEIKTPSPISLYQSIFVSFYIHSFWQPPKLNS